MKKEIKRNEEWPTLFISFYAMCKMFIGQFGQFNNFYKKDRNYLELIDGYYTLKNVLRNKETRRQLGFLYEFKAVFYLSLILKMLNKLNINTSIPKIGYPFIEGKSYEIAYSVNNISGSREYLSCLTIDYNSRENHPYNFIPPNSIVSVRVL